MSVEVPVSNAFVSRHIGPDAAEIAEMLEVVGAASLDALIDETIPARIRTQTPLSLPAPLDEFGLLQRVRAIASLLDIIFRWVPFFILCFRLPGFKAKQS